MDMKNNAMNATRWPLGLALALLLVSFGFGCGKETVDPCDDRRAASLTCVALQLTWLPSASATAQAQQIDQIILLVSGDWVGHSAPTPAAPFTLPAAAAVT